MNRGSWVRALIGTLLITAAASNAVAAEDTGPIKIGVLTDMSGPDMDMSGPGSVVAAKMAVEEIGGTVLGRPVEIVVGDHQLKADIGSQIARRWYDTENVQLIISVPVSSVGLAVQFASRERHKLMITTGSITSDFTGKFCSPYSMQWLFNTNALANGTVKTLVNQGKKNWYFLTADYAFGQALERDASKIVTDNGGTVVGRVRHPFNATDLTSFVVQAVSSQADVVALANGPPDNMNAMKAIREFGGLKGNSVLAGLFVGISDIHGAGLAATQGLLLTEGFYWDMDEKSRAWSKRFSEKTGKMPTAVQAADYSSVLHYLKAVKQAGTTDPDKVAAAMRAIPVEDSFARHGTLRKSGLMVHDLVLVKVKKPEQSKSPWDYYDVVQTIPGSAAFAPEASEGCPLVSDAAPR